MRLVSNWDSSLHDMGLMQFLRLLIQGLGSPIVGTVVLEDRVEIEPNIFLRGGRDMIQDERRILGFCMGKWTHLTVLEEQISRSTLYRIAKKLCGRKWLLHRRARGYITTKRGTQMLKESQGGVEALKEDTSSQKGVLREKEEPRELKRPPVNLPAIRKFLKLSDETVDCFPSLYPPLRKMPTPTHRAMAELLLAEVCDRAWPLSDFHHLNFLNFGATLRWKTHLALFCAYMVMKEGEDISSYLIEASLESGYSFWIRGRSSGNPIFKRQILQKPYVCLEDYHKADTASKRATGHLLSGRLKIPWQNTMESIFCVAMVNLNPWPGKTLLQKTGFDNPVIRRLIPCDFNAIEIPKNLREIGNEATDAAKDSGPLAKEKPRFDCKDYKHELIEYTRKLFTQEGQELIDTDGLLNLARGLTGYGLTASEAIRYTLYKTSLPYHTVGWLRLKWIQGFRERPVDRIKKMPAPEMEITKTSSQIPVERDKKDFENIQDTIKFQEEYQDELNKLKKFNMEIKEFKEFLEQKDISLKRISQIFIEEGYGVPSPERCENAVQEIEKKYRDIQGRDWPVLREFKKANEWLSKTYIKPLTDSEQRIKIYKERWNYLWEKISNIKKIDQITAISEMVDKSPLVVSQKGRLKELIEKKRTALEETTRALREKHLFRISKVDTFPGWVKAYELILNDSSLSEELKNELGQVLMEKYRKLSIEIKRNLISYLKKEDAPARDITQELMGLGLIRKVTIVGSSKLEGIDGNTYPLDEFDFSQYQLEENFSGVLTIDRCKEEALCLLTPKIENKTPKDLDRHNIREAFAQPKKTEEEMTKWEKVVIGSVTAGFGAYGTYSFLKNRKDKMEQDLLSARRLNEKDEEIPINQLDELTYREENKLQLTSEPEITPGHQNYYEGQKVWIIEQGEYTYTIRLQSGEDIPVKKSEVTLRK